jgi:hypothetical protein
LKFKKLLTAMVLAVAASAGCSSAAGGGSQGPLGEGTVADPTASFTVSAGPSSAAPGVSVMFPPGALPAGAKVRLATAPALVVPGMVGVGPVIKVNIDDPDGSPIHQLPADLMAVVTLPYRAGLAADSLRGYTANDDGTMVSRLEAGPAATGSAMELLTSHFSLFALMSPAPGATNKSVSQIVVSHLNLVLEWGQTETVDATVLAADGTVLTDKTVLWTIDDKTVATLNDDAAAAGDLVEVKAVGRGTTAINVTVDGEIGVNAVVLVSVPDAPIAEVKIIKLDGALEVGVPAQLTAKALDPNGNDITAGKLCSWSTSDQTTATITDDGVLTAYKTGVVDVTATCADVPGTLHVSIDSVGVWFLYGFTAGAPASCSGSFIGSFMEPLHTMVIPGPYLQNPDRDQLMNDLDAQLRTETPNQPFYTSSWVSDRTHVVFALADVTYADCVSKVMFVGKGWSYEEATADAKAQVANKVGADASTFSVYRQIAGP